MIHEPPDKVERLLLVAAIFTQSVPEQYRNLGASELFTKRKQVLGAIAVTTLTRKVFDHHATLEKTVKCLSRA